MKSMVNISNSSPLNISQSINVKMVKLVKVLDKRFWLISKSYLWLNKIVHGPHSIKRTSWNGKWCVTKSRLDNWLTDERRGA